MEKFLNTGAAIAIVAAIVFLGFCFWVARKNGQASPTHTFIFFAVSMLLLALFLFEWRFTLRSIEQETQGTLGLAPINAGLGQWGQILLSGIGAALLTLGGSTIVTWWMRPQLKIEFENNKRPFCVKDPPNQGQIYWLRVKITNSGRSTAKNCLGRIVQFLDDKGKPIMDHDPVQLHWVGTPWVSKPEELTLLKLHKLDLQKGRSEFLDTLVMKPEHDRALLFMSRDNLFGASPDKIPEGTIAFQVTVYGDNVNPCTKTYSITYGQSYDSITLT